MMHIGMIQIEKLTPTEAVRRGGLVQSVFGTRVWHASPPRYGIRYGMGLDISAALGQKQDRPCPREGFLTMKLSTTFPTFLRRAALFAVTGVVLLGQEKII
jgi:hypothetical protein